MEDEADMRSVQCIKKVRSPTSCSPDHTGRDRSGPTATPRGLIASCIAKHPEALLGRLSRLIHDAEDQDPMLAQAAGLGCAVTAVTDPSPPGFDMDPLESPSGRQGGSSVMALSASQVSDASLALEKPKTFTDTFRKALDQPLLRSPRLRITRSARRSLDPDFVPKRSARLAAKSGFREGRPDA
jgi:hypothetical protein